MSKEFDVESKLNDICCSLDSVVSCFKTDIMNGALNTNLAEMGEAADIVEDLSCACKNLLEANYYYTVIKAMNEPEDERRYYSNRMPGRNTQVYSYKPMVDQEPYVDAYLNDRTEYDKYMTSKRHYTQTGSSTDKMEMDRHAKKHVYESINTIEDIWDEASPELKAQMKSDLTRLYESIMK